MQLSPNSLAFVALCNEYCAAIENASQSDPQAFIAEMVRLLPRIYITASDLKPAPSLDEESPYIDSYLDEYHYESLRSAIEGMLRSEEHTSELQSQR